MHKAIRKYCQDCFFVFAAILLLLSSAAIGAEQGSAADIKAQQGLQTKITYSCVNLPIDTVLMELAKEANIDIVKSPKVTGNVTVKVTDVPLEEALSHILAAHDYTYIATENMIRVIPVSEITALKDPLVTRIYRITYADANEVAKALGSFVSERGKVAFNRSTSHIIVTDIESKIKGIDKFINEIDLMTPQVLVDVRIYDITSNEGFEFDPAWHIGRNTPLKTTDVSKIDSDTDYPRTINETTTYTETTSGNYRDADDGPPSSFTVTGNETKTTELPRESYLDTTTERYTTMRRKPFVGGSFDRLSGGTLNFSLLNDAVDVELALNILHKQVEAKLLANPRVLVLDNETADFEIIREIPYRELRQVAREDPITYTEFKNVGVQLKVTPHITRDGMIKLHIVPEFGILVSKDSNGLPTVDTRRADTIALVKDSQTIVIGGLRKRETSKDISKVPLLGDIPLLGSFFKSETETKVTRELVVFITPRIVTEPTLSATEKKQLEATELADLNLTKMKPENNKQPELKELTELLDMLSQKDEL